MREEKGEKQNKQHKQQHRFQFDNATHFIFLLLVFLVVFLFCFFFKLSDPASCVCQTSWPSTEEGGRGIAKRNSVLSFFVLLFSYLATPDDHSETTSMASTGRQEQRGEKALVPHARIRSPKQRETKRRRAR